MTQAPLLEILESDYYTCMVGTNTACVSDFVRNIVCYKSESSCMRWKFTICRYGLTNDLAVSWKRRLNKGRRICPVLHLCHSQQTLKDHIYQA